MSQHVVRAAGGVVWRPDPDGGDAPLVALVHRPRYDDWSLPKGKLDRGEHPLAAAVREVYEETAVRAAPQVRLPDARYRVPAGSGVASGLLAAAGRGQLLDKTVEYWSMRAWSWTHRPADREVDQVRWLSPTAACGALSYRYDRDVLLAFSGRQLVTGVVAVVRRADQIAGLLALLRPTRILAATRDSAVAAAGAVAAATGRGVESDGRFDSVDAVPTAAEAVAALGAAVDSSVVCCRGRLIPQLVAALAGGPAERYPTPRGTGWLLGFAAGRLVATSRLSADG